ncbi:MAG TPA: hypothetical protein VGL63_16170 [Streptosporangiaceae bacterium]|jgi:hypothetical protein
MAEPPDFDRLFHSVTRSAVHLEMRDDYSGSSPAFAAWRERRPYDRSGPDAAWHAFVGSAIRRGVTVRRARIISEPVSDYIRFEYEVTPAANLAAGEHVRWLPRPKASDLSLPGNDFWLFDDTAVLFNYFSGDGAPAGTEVRDDPAVVKLCAAAFEAVWDRAVPHEQHQLA